MYIKSFYIDGFGLLSQVGVENLPQGLSVFLGKNEAGKSTCLDFFRTMLTGYPSSRSKKTDERDYTPLAHSGQAGGFLALQTKEHGLIRLTRRPQKGKDDVVLTDANGQILDTIILDSMLAGITREVYRNVFGFSLSELQTFASLDSDGIRDALYGASFGMGLLPPGVVLKKINDYMGKQFKTSGSIPSINTALSKLELIQREIHLAHATCARFDALTLEKNNLEIIIKDLRTQKNSTENHRRNAERQLGVWRQWDEWRTLESRLLRLEHIPDSFPEDGPARLSRAQELQQDASRRLHTQKERFQKIEQSIAELEINPTLLQHYTLLQSLSERKTSFRQAQSSLAPQNATIQRNQATLDQYLADLGPDWTCERIRKTDRSLFAKSEIEKQASDIQAAEQSHLASIQLLEKAHNYTNQAKQEHELAKKSFNSLPDATLALDDMVRENVRNSVAIIENTQATLAEKQHALQTATNAFHRTLSPLQIRIPASESHAKAMQKLENLLENQDKSLLIADECHKAQQQTRDAEQVVAQVQENEEMARIRLERARRYSRDNSTSPKSVLDIRAKTVRGLRTLYNNYSGEKERLDELNERINTSIAPAPVKSLALMSFGFMILALGLAAIITPMHFDITEIQITPRLIIPLTQWSSYLVLLTGAAFLAGGMPRSGPETSRYAHEQQELKARAEAMRLRLTEMEKHIQEQCHVAQVQSADNVTLDAVELLLEREREQFAANERLEVEIKGLDAEFCTIHEKLKQKKELLNKAQNVEQQARLKWHDFLRSHHVEAIPAPESAATFFARVESVILTHDNLKVLQAEVAQLELQISEHITSLWQVSAIQNVTEHAKKIKQEEQEAHEAHERESQGDPTSEQNDEINAQINTTPTPLDILYAAKQTLENCRHVDDTQTERLKAEAIVQNAAKNCEMARNSQNEAAEAVQRAEKHLEHMRNLWSKRLEELNMEDSVSPTMLRNALESMERCLIVEQEIASAEEEKIRLENECEALITPLKSILSSLNKELPLGGNADIPHQEDWLSTLDALLFDAQLTHDNEKLKDQYNQQLASQEQELHEVNTALNDAKDTEQKLLNQAGTNNVEEFLRLAKVRTESHEILQRKADLEDALRLAAGENNFEDFLKSFTQTDQHERELFIKSMQENLDAFNHEEQEKSTELAVINAELNSLTTEDDLARLRQEESDLQESIKNASQNWASFALARQLILQAKQRFESERQPQVIRMASEIFANITGGRWQGITAQLEENSLQVFPPHGAPTSPLNLSRGTQEQLYLALRLAYIRNHAEHATALPVIMDDILVNFDQDRAMQTAKAMLNLNQGKNKHQLLFFTCHPHIAEMLQELSPKSKLFSVDGGTIKSAG